MLEIRDLTVRYGDRVALDAVDLCVGDHELVCLLGPSGSGKSTLLRAVAGLEVPASGHIGWDGVDLAGVPVHRRRFGLMFQDHALFPHRDVLGNVEFGLRIAGMSAAARDERAKAALDRVGLAGFDTRRVRELSGGEQQRVALARALAPEPRLLMLDEPLGSLDRELRERLVAELRAVLRAVGMTTLFVTHDQDEAFAIADRVVLLRDGRIEQSGTPEDVWRHPATEFAARFLGCSNVLDGQIDEDGLELPWGRMPAPAGVPAGPVRVAVRPEGLRLGRAPREVKPPHAPSAAIRHASDPIVGTVRDCTFRRDHFVVVVETAVGALEVAAADAPPPGARCVVSVEHGAVVVLPT
jgi:thiamine transport system ATP-binding protein